MEELSTPSRKTWKPTPQEQWVWQRLCAGEIANFNEAEGYGGKLDPNKPGEWPENRVLRPGFLEAVLLREAYRSALPQQGVRIVGAWFKEPLNMSYFSLAHPLWLECCRFEGMGDFSFLETSRAVSLGGSTFKEVDLRGARIGGYLNMSEKATFKDVILVGAWIGGYLSMIGSAFDGPLNMSGMQVEQSLWMKGKASFKKVNLVGARIGEWLDMNGSAFDGPLNMNSIEVEKQ